MRIGLDVMGGDHAPHAILDGAFAALEQLDESDSLHLVGDEAVIRADGQSITLGDEGILTMAVE